MSSSSLLHDSQSNEQDDHSMPIGHSSRNGSSSNSSSSSPPNIHQGDAGSDASGGGVDVASNNMSRSSQSNSNYNHNHNNNNHHRDAPSSRGPSPVVPYSQGRTLAPSPTSRLAASATAAATETETTAAAAAATTTTTTTPMAVDGGEDDASDAYIANALQNMSLQERDDLYHELHGVADVIDESPAFLKACFQQLHDELAVEVKKTFVGSLNCRPFQLAEQQSYDYVHSEFLYKAFLRAERFNVPAAAKRMIRYFEYKLQSFGVQHLCDDITQELLSEQDLKVYRNGYIQVLPCRDAMGRAILINFPTLTLTHKVGTSDRMGRLFMYENWSLIQDEETQRKGATIVVIVNPGRKAEYSSSSVMVDPEMIPQTNLALLCFPLRYAVVHHCFSDSQWRAVMKLGMQLVNRDIRARNKIHFGAPMECAFELMGFGIPPDCLPVNMHGDVKTKQHVEWIKMRKKQEEMAEQGKLIPLSSKGKRGYKQEVEEEEKDNAMDHVGKESNGKNNSNGSNEVGDNDVNNYASQSDPTTVIVIPALADILLGRGKPIHSHPGNVRLHQLVDEAIPRYEACRKLEKTGLTIELVKKIKDDGGRFLKQEASGVWLVTDDEASRNKVSHLFRARRAAVLEQMAKQEQRRKQQQQQRQKVGGGGGGGDNNNEGSTARNGHPSDVPPAGKRSKLESV